MLVEDSEVTIEDEHWAEPAPVRIDRRVCKEPRRCELADKLALSLVERIEPSVTLEVGTVATAMAEITERIPVPEKTVLLEPAVAAALATTKGTKGCRACMGKWFEEIRLRPSTKPPRVTESPEFED